MGDKKTRRGDVIRQRGRRREAGGKETNENETKAEKKQMGKNERR